MNATACSRRRSSSWARRSTSPEENACRIEHVVSDELMAVLENFIA